MKWCGIIIISWILICNIFNDKKIKCKFDFIKYTYLNYSFQKYPFAPDPKSGRRRPWPTCHKTVR